jgi:hypothetical protein
VPISSPKKGDGVIVCLVIVKVDNCSKLRNYCIIPELNN